MIIPKAWTPEFRLIEAHPDMLVFKLEYMGAEIILQVSDPKQDPKLSCRVSNVESLSAANIKWVYTRNVDVIYREADDAATEGR